VSTSSALRPPRPLARAAPWLVAAVLLSGVGVPTVGGAFGHLPSMPSVGFARPAAAAPISIQMTDQPRFSPAYVTVPAGTNATFHLVNSGGYGHTFTLLAKPNVVLNTSWTPTQVDQYLAGNGTLANVTVAAGAQANATVAFNSSTGFDSFEFLSVVPYQFQAGMFGFVNISSTAPGLIAFDNTTDTYSFVPDVLVANPTHYPFNLDVLVTNTGNLGHTFTVAAQSNYTLSVANFSSYFQAHPPLVSAAVPGGAGSAVWANFTVVAPGVYMYICTVTGHFNAGMDGQLYVGIAPPPPAPAPSTAVIQGWILVGSGVLLGVGITLAAMTAYMGRFPPPAARSHH
jgi:uncharacterized cupredoxin-like copper-binding protein